MRNLSYKNMGNLYLGLPGNQARDLGIATVYQRGTLSTNNGFNVVFSSHKANTQQCKCSSALESSMNIIFFTFFDQKLV